MVTEIDKDDPIARLARMGKRDRDAVLQNLSLEERARVEQALREHEIVVANELERQQRIDRQFLLYSPRLASLIEATENSVPENLTETAARACWQIHSGMVASQAPTARIGVFAQLDRLVEWFGPIRKDGK